MSFNSRTGRFEYDRNSYDPYKSQGPKVPYWLWAPPAVVLGITAAIMVIWFIVWLIGLFWGTSALIYRDSVGAIQQLLFPGGLPTPFFWIIVMLTLAAMLLTYALSEGSKLAPLAVVAVVALFIGVLGLGITKGVTNDILASDYYLTTTTFKVPNPDNMPSILTKYVSDKTLRVKVEKGDLPKAWVPRVASATGALNLIKKAADAVNNTELLDDTMTYLYGEGDSGKWSVIRNGLNQQDIYGVSSWDGTSSPISTCRFTGNYELRKAFDAPYGRDLWYNVAHDYPSFYYDQEDMWGYCKGNEPIIVIPGVQLGYTDMRSVDKPSGVVTIEGSRSGTPVLKYFSDIKPGQFPGPVYPERLVNSQRNLLDWGAGYWQAVNEHFGFDVTDAESQAGNNTNYLMKNEADGRLYWMTPLRAQSASSETLVGYSFTRADEVSTSKLNEQIVYVTDDSNPSKVVSLTRLYNRVKTAMCDTDTNFCNKNSTGDIIEFLPLSDTVWQAFGEVGGSVLYRIDVDVRDGIDPHVVKIASGESSGVTATPGSGSTPAPTGSSTPAPAGSVDCNAPSTLTVGQIADCQAALAKELQGRSNK